MSVKRYEIIESSSVFEDADGVLIDYSDYAALEARCAALAAENSGLKCALNKIAFTYPLSPHIHEMTTIKTPATDAFMAEVRAQGVEMLTADRRREWMDSYIDDANEFAAQLRKGGV